MFLLYRQRKNTQHAKYHETNAYQRQTKQKYFFELYMLNHLINERNKEQKDRHTDIQAYRQTEGKKERQMK